MATEEERPVAYKRLMAVSKDPLRDRIDLLSIIIPMMADAGKVLTAELLKDIKEDLARLHGLEH